MNFEVTYISRGDIRLKSQARHVRVLGEALVSTSPTEPSYVVYLSSLKYWEDRPDVALTETQKRDIVSAIMKHFQGRGSVVEFE